MIRLLIILVTLSLLGITAAWVAEHPGNVTMYWFDYRIDTSIAVLGLLLLLAGILIAWFYMMFRALVLLPKTIHEQRSLRNYKKGLQELTHSVVALASADARVAHKHTQKAEKYLGSSPITLLLSAQVSRLQGDDVQTQLLLEKMIDHKETEYIAARYLSESATKQNHLTLARELATRAQKASAQGTPALLSLHMQLDEWQQGWAVLQKALQKGTISRNELRHYQAILLTQQATSMLNDNNVDSAVATAKRATRIRTDFSPAFVVYFRALLRAGQDAKVRSLLLQRWKREPSVLYKVLLQNATANMPKEKAAKYLQKLTSMKPDAYASHLCVAHIAVTRGDWHIAREALKKALSIMETAEAFKLMAEVEKGEYSDYDAAARWLTKSTEATRAPEWVCHSCGQTNDNWQSHCGNCHSFDTLEWRRRDMAYVNHSHE